MCDGAARTRLRSSPTTRSRALGGARATARSSTSGWPPSSPERSARRTPPTWSARRSSRSAATDASELCPQSDLDVMLLRSPRRDVTAISERVWYPIWDAGLKLGHSVCTQREALEIADERSRHRDRAAERAPHRGRRVARRWTSRAAALSQWEQRSKRWLEALASRVDERHAQAGEVAFMLEPDLKEGRGGLRDVHSLHWAQAARSILLEHDEVSLATAYATLLDARVELHRRTGRPSNVLALQEQDAVADGARPAGRRRARWPASRRPRARSRGRATTRGAACGRRCAGRSAGSASAIGRSATACCSATARCTSTADADPADDPLLALRAARSPPSTRPSIDRDSLERLAASAPRARATRGRPARVSSSSGCCSRAADAIPVIEALDHRGIWTRILPEWEPVRSRPQHNAYHRFTVDRHLLETTANAAALRGPRRPARPARDGRAAARPRQGRRRRPHELPASRSRGALGTRLGFADADVDVIAELVANHLLLSEVAVRRDLDDPATIATRRRARVVGRRRCDCSRR